MPWMAEAHFPLTAPIPPGACVLYARLSPAVQHLDSMLAALTHHRTSGSIAIRQNVLRPLPTLLHKCGGSLRSSL